MGRELGKSPNQINEAEIAAEVKEWVERAIADELGMRLPALQKLNDMRVTNVVSHSFGVVAVKDGARTLEANQCGVHLRIMESRREPRRSMTSNREARSATPCCQWPRTCPLTHLSRSPSN